jgi:hypothetical protein
VCPTGVLDSSWVDKACAGRIDAKEPSSRSVPACYTKSVELLGKSLIKKLKIVVGIVQEEVEVV